MLPDVIPLKPFLQEKIWGGRELQKQFGKSLPEGKRIGESWEVSAYEGMESVVSGGDFEGWTLRRLVEAHGQELMGDRTYNRYDGEFPLLIKLLDAREDLSIQVHPDDSYVRENGLGNFGKMEAWYVLRSENGRIAYGLNGEITKAEFEAAIEAGRVEDAVQFFDVQPGEVVFMPPGVVHALCQGVMAYEVQQSSDVTFRIYDYGRPGDDGKPRELHIKQSLEVMEFGGDLRKPFRCEDLRNSETLVKSEHFELRHFQLEGDSVVHESGDSFSAVTFIAGSAEIAGKGGGLKVAGGDTILVPEGRKFKLVKQCSTAVEYLISSVP